MRKLSKNCSALHLHSLVIVPYILLNERIVKVVVPSQIWEGKRALPRLIHRYQSTYLVPVGDQQSKVRKIIYEGIEKTLT